MDVVSDPVSVKCINVKGLLYIFNVNIEWRCGFEYHPLRHPSICHVNICTAAIDLQNSKGKVIPNIIW